MAIKTAYDIYTERTETILGVLDDSILLTNTDIIRFVGYIYQYVMLMDLVGIQLERNPTLVERFIKNPHDHYSSDELVMIAKLHTHIIIRMNQLLEQNIHSESSFPSLPTLNVVSVSGSISESDIYISGLLEDFASKPRMNQYIEKCALAIIAASESSSEHNFHYNRFITSRIHIGGLLKPDDTAHELSHQHIIHLGTKYIGYLKNALITGKRLNYISIGKRGMYGCGDIEVCECNLKNLISLTGLLKDSLHEYEEFVKQYDIMNEE